MILFYIIYRRHKQLMAMIENKVVASASSSLFFQFRFENKAQNGSLFTNNSLSLFLFFPVSLCYNKSLCYNACNPSYIANDGRHEHIRWVTACLTGRYQQAFCQGEVLYHSVQQHSCLQSITTWTPSSLVASLTTSKGATKRSSELERFEARWELNDERVVVIRERKLFQARKLIIGVVDFVFVVCRLSPCVVWPQFKQLKPTLSHDKQHFRIDFTLFLCWFVSNKLFVAAAADAVLALIDRNETCDWLCVLGVNFWTKFRQPNKQTNWLRL